MLLYLFVPAAPALLLLSVRIDRRREDANNGPLSPHIDPDGLRRRVGYLRLWTNPSSLPRLQAGSPSPTWDIVWPRMAVAEVERPGQFWRGAGTGARHAGAVPAISPGETALQQASAAFDRRDRDAVIVHLSAAVRAFSEDGSRRDAAMACVRLGEAMATLMGNQTASRVWFARAERLIRDEPDCIEQGWVAVAAMGCDVDDPDELLAKAELALVRARQFGDVNLETKALADAGLAHVQAGRVQPGMELLDEAMALACGPADKTDAAAKSVCSFFTACTFAGEFGRARAWEDLLRKCGLIGDQSGPAVFLSSHCNSVWARSLIELGRWGEAEAVLTRAKTEFEAVMGVPSWHPDITLADLRTRQGRVADAEALLLGKEHSMEAVLPSARMHLARRDTALALAIIRRGLRSLGADRLRAIELHALSVDAHLAEHNIDAARTVAATLAELTEGIVAPATIVRAENAVARVLVADGNLVEAITNLERASDRLEPDDAPWPKANLLLELARVRQQAGDHANATVDLMAARRLLADLDVTLGDDERQLLELPVPVAGAHPEDRSRAVATVRRARSGWEVSWGGTKARVRATKGMSYLAELVAHAGCERHVLDLVDKLEGVHPDRVDRRQLGHAGPALDGPARTAYRHEIERLRLDIDDALAAERWEDAERLQGELDQLVGQLAGAFGIGGRDRTAASAAERARLNVTRALRTAIATIYEALPQAGSALDRSVRTGRYCVYEPVPGDIRWIVQS